MSGVCIREVSVLQKVSVLERCLYQRCVSIRKVSVLESCLYEKASVLEMSLY